ncbi:MAG: gluconate 2-dehydrogenase subunit 3 family protein, partial [Chloroflexota bacterium]|nr:gluconate 2-dehydrogenase subunit 3 family protein [Chloroflexota bacterium]
MTACTTLTQREAGIVAAVFNRLFPPDDLDPGAVEIGAVTYLDRALGGWLRDEASPFRANLLRLDDAVRGSRGTPFADLEPGAQDDTLVSLERGELPGFEGADGIDFFRILLARCQEGLFADPIYGGNREESGWRAMRHPGITLANSAEDNLATTSVDFGGQIRSLEDVVDELRAQTHPDLDLPNFNPRAGLEPPTGPVDVVLVGVGAVGGLIAPILTKAGLKVVGLEAGPYRSFSEFIPDELGATYYCRQNLGPKFMREEVRWRTDEGEPTQDPTYSLGRMMNNAGGSVIHYGAWLRRFHPHHFRLRSHIVERWGEEAIPEGCTVADWPMSYDDLEPYFTKLDWEIGIAGDDRNPYLRRSKGYPLPPTRPFRLGERFAETTREMGLHPHAVPVGYNTAPYNGFPEATYTAWDNGFGSWTGAKWHPGLTAIPAALATGDFTLRTECRVTRILTNADGRATGVEYVDASGRMHQQMADTVVLCSYTWENLRLLFLSADGKHPDGLGNSTGQLGKHLMIKMFAHVGGFFPDETFNRHTGPAAQGVVLDDFLHEGFDSWTAGEFLG